MWSVLKSTLKILVVKKIAIIFLLTAVIYLAKFVSTSLYSARRASKLPYPSCPQNPKV